MINQSMQDLVFRIKANYRYMNFITITLKKFNAHLLFTHSYFNL